MRVVGVDGCAGGWIAVVWDTEARSLIQVGLASLSEVIAAFPGSYIGIDIPIGLSDLGGRPCDTAARKLLGQPRGSSVFPPPVPGIIHLPTYPAASAASREAIGKGISKQSFSLFPKMRQAAEAITPAMQDWAFEIHPELSFWALAGRAMEYPKRGMPGYEERRNLLNRELDLAMPIGERSEVSKLVRGIGAGPDDYLDATVAAWTARRAAEGVAIRLNSGVADLAANGLRMEMVY